MNDINRAALTAALESSARLAIRFELLPISGLRKAARELPEGAVVTVTCSPRHGLERTLEATEWLVGEGFRVVPHLAARLVRNHGHLKRLLQRVEALGIEDVFVVGGDVPRAVGDYPHGLALLEAMAGLALRPVRIGVPAYPEGHHRIEAPCLQQDLEAKAALADYAVTQLCFEARPLLDWRDWQARLGLRLPVHAGVPGVIERKRLLGIALRLGIGSSVQALRRQSGRMSRLLGPLAYRPDALVDELGARLGDSVSGFAGLHVYTFNQVAATRNWLEELGDRQLTSSPEAKRVPCK
ncbi:methylenetetrahydrofolate reductase (NADPH) [Modicisalibacter muralis]|uniref:Methylenetetrahydrofolate reductase n=1 Tax=Modicisalibacter muralis TaxID=119000 RepID=A0A1G9RXX1_9GAMM|nr:methylenetetrahydrofolate reductase [Halomonas muralis]SDM28086.1 methylenetetrahydrofolate reductase (NADPH) [Halomonas muralis]